MRIIKNKEEAKKYIEDLKDDVFLMRIESDRLETWGDSKPYSKITAEEHLSNWYSNQSKTEKGTFDGYVVSLKEKTLFDLLEKYPDGIKINDVGGMCPLNI